jgi:Tol biopolymer transport system component
MPRVFAIRAMAPLLTLLANAHAAVQAPPAQNSNAPVQLTAEQDHQRIIGLLHVSALRRGPDGDPASPHAANFDESKVAPYPHIPDPLLLNNGARVRSSDVWWNERRPQIVELFDEQIYGRVPEGAPSVSWQVQRTLRGTIGDLPVITKEIVGHLDNSSYPHIDVDIQLTLTTPAGAAGAVPVVLELGLSADALAAMRKRFTEAQWAALRGSGPSWQSQVLAKGWGYATLVAASVQADNGEGLTQGVIGLANRGKPRRLDDWGALRAWAWGVSRALDYFETDASVDSARIGIEGLSRYGKAALVAMAYEPRLRIGFIGSSGAGGAKILRRNFGEQVENIASSAEYHWMAGNFLKYAGTLTADDLPVDAHELIALCAPRPIFIGSGSQEVEGGWVDAKGMFLGAVGAGPVYTLLGKKDLGTGELPPIGTALAQGDIAFRQHDGGHTNAPNWPAFLVFADRYLGTPNARRPAALGHFDGQSAVGSAAASGSAHYDDATNTYTLVSAGANTWYHVDSFDYIWKKASGDLALSADISFPPHSCDHEPNPHRKGLLMIRQSLDAGSSYAAVAVHGSGMTALQFRRARGANTEDVELNIEAPRTIRIEKRGDTINLLLSMKGEPLHRVGAAVKLHFTEPFYVGLGALSHDTSSVDRVEFSRVSLDAPVNPGDTKLARVATLQTIQIDDQFRRAMVIRTTSALMQSANWAPEGKSIYVHEAGRVINIPYLTPEAGGTPRVIDVGALKDCSGNFGISPDGKWLAMSCAESRGAAHQIYVLPAQGGAPRKITTGAAPSYFHAWSQDTRTIAFTRGSAGHADIFTIAAAGGAEIRLTTDTVNDGPDFSPDGKFIYFDSSRSGATQIWRMQADGTGAEQLTDDENENSSPHVSPDGKNVAFLSQPPDSGGTLGDATLKVIAPDGFIRSIATLQGDRGSLSMYCWGDSSHIAFITYQMSPIRHEPRVSP